MIEERDGADVVQSRYTYGNGIDELIEIEREGTVAGQLESFYPAQSANGSVLAVTDKNGELVERVKFTAYGIPTFIIDHTPPEVDVARIEGGNILLRFSEPVKREAAEKSIKLKKGDDILSGSITFEDNDKLVKFTPSSPLPQNEEITLTITTDLEDMAGNKLGQEFSTSFIYTGANLIIYDKSAPEIESIRLVGKDFLIEFNEEIDQSSTANSIELSYSQETITGETALDNSKTIKFTPSKTLLQNIKYTIIIKASVKDLSGKSLSEPVSKQFTYPGIDIAIFEKPDPNKKKQSSIGNTCLFQGREYDNETGLYYYRARYLYPELGRFLQPDPRGYMDSMNLYQSFGSNPMNFSDPMGQKVYSHNELQLAYTISRWFGLNMTYEQWLDRYVETNSYARYVHRGQTEYIYDPRDWEKGGDVITQGKEYYIHHNPSYSLIPITKHTYSIFFEALHSLFPSTPDYLQQEYKAIHRFTHPFDPKYQLEHPLVDPDVKRSAQETIFRYHIEDRKNALYVFESYRAFERSDELHAKGKGMAGGYSWHNYGLAVDIAFQTANGQPTWNAQIENWNKLKRIGLSSGFTASGADFGNLVDRAHLQRTFSREAPQGILEIYNQYGGRAVGVRAVQSINRQILNLVYNFILR